MTATAQRSLWFLMPIVLLGGLLSLLGTLVFVATNDDGFAIEPDYYLKAVRWDEAQRAREASAALGWDPTVRLLRQGTTVTLQLTLDDARSARVTGAHISVEAFPNAHAGELHRVTLSETAPGVYQGTLESARAGLWEVRIEARGAGAERFLGVARVDVEGAR